MSTFATVLSTGRYLPERRIANEDLTQFPKMSLPLIAAKTGVQARRHADDADCTSDLALRASRVCLQKCGFAPALLEGIILSTSSPDRPQPATATRVQGLLGATSAFALDVNAVCSGGIYALHLADSLIRSGRHKYILVIGAEIYSRILNPRDFSTYPYFGDGAGAILLGPSAEPGLIYTELGADGAGAELIRVPAGGSMMPPNKLSKPEDIYFKMSGREVFEFAVSKGSEILRAALTKCDLRAEQIRWFVSHQANINILNELADRLEVPREVFAVTLKEYGNTASASILITLDDLIDNGQVERGDLIALAAFGGGLAWGAGILRY